MTTTVFRHEWSRTDDGGARPRRVAQGRTKPIADSARMFIPPGWPEQVLPPTESDWEASAVGFLLDCCPPEYRGYPLLRRQPVVLARFAAQFVESQLRATRDGIAQARSSLGDYVDVPVLDDSVDVLQREEARLVRLRRAVMLVEESLRGKIFIARL
ncbi:hypothetical protein ACPCG0_00775 [Propionibacteriaceae bacterium Y1923]|uniref:hypothetical protein n=1 Tax=Aestuariimicrobium sp. Y1814 TaxID=3418742 RepID=UPI003C271DE1